MEGKSRKLRFGRWLFLLALVVVVVAIVLNREWIYDFCRGRIYKPSSEMMAIRESLGLTSRGKFLFDASHPELNNEEDFNTNCRSDDEESAVLGCYTERNIYVYNIVDDRLNGIRELTTAHELLHAVYERMSEGDKDALRPELERVYQENQDILKEEVEAYDSTEQLEEIYVRAGTEVKKLPDSLEKHFAEIFENQDRVVDFYNNYIGVFKQLEAELQDLESEMAALNDAILKKTDEYEQWATKLNSDISSFNNCANTIGCFGSEYEFRAKRNQLIAEQGNLEDLYNEIDEMINKYNTLVEKYNNNVIESNNLQNIINSHVKVEGI